MCRCFSPQLLQGPAGGTPDSMVVFLWLSCLYDDASYLSILSLSRIARYAPSLMKQIHSIKFQK